MAAAAAAATGVVTAPTEMLLKRMKFAGGIPTDEHARSSWLRMAAFRAAPLVAVSSAATLAAAVALAGSTNAIACTSVAAAGAWRRLRRPAIAAGIDGADWKAEATMDVTA